MRDQFRFIGFITLFICCILTSACKFPDNLPDYQNLLSYRMDKLAFGKTTEAEFEKLSDGKPAEKVGKDIQIFLSSPASKDFYEQVRVGFRNDKLDWIEFTLNKDIEMSKIVQIYNNPRAINSAYSKVLDYYDYGYFNISTDKKRTLAKHITFFDIPQSIKKEPQINLGNKIPAWQNLKKNGFLNLHPGITIETDFNRDYPYLSQFKKDNSDTDSTYRITQGLAGTNYKKADLVFNNGLLSWINIVPQNLSLNDFIKTYGSAYKLEKFNAKFDIYDFAEFVLIVNRAQKKVVNIGIMK